ncbi:MAG: sugar ABC transporter permease [Clostridia bacterium]|nr:sugar ABC transporter permease [Clostridia bacterium]
MQKQTQRHLSREKKETLQEILFVAPQLILYLTFTILPFFVAVPLVLTDRKTFLDNVVSFVGLRNFVTIFQEPFVSEFIPALKRTIIFTILNYASVYIFGLTMALIMFEYNSKLKKPFFTVIYMPYMISGLGTGMLLTLLFAKDTGSMNLLLQHLGLISKPIDIKSQAAVTWALPVTTGWRYAGVNMAFFLGGLLSIPPESIEAAVVDGANYRQKLFYIYLPQIIPSIVMATVTCLIGSFNLIDELFGMGAMYGNQSAVFLSVLVFQKGFVGGLSQSVAMSLTVFVPLIIIAFFMIRWQKKMQY